MTRTQLVFRNTLRNRRRTILTVASVAVSTCLVAILWATYRYLQAPPEMDRTHLILSVTARTSVTIPLPVSYQSQIAKVPGVAAAMPLFWFDGRYGKDADLVPALALDAQKLLAFLSNWHVPEDQLRAFVGERDALVAGRKVVDKYDWKVGDHVHLRSPNYSDVDLDLILRAVYTSDGDQSMLALHWDYLNEALGHPDKAGQIWVLARSVDDIPHLMNDIDDVFRNAPMETRTQTLKQLVVNFLGWLGNLKDIMLMISTAVVFAVLLVVTNTMAMSIRERTAELAVMRALGFRSRQVLAMLAGEALTISLVGTTLGLALAALVFRLMEGYHIGGAMPAHIRVDAITMALSLLVAVIISLGSTLLPAYRAARLNVAEALRFVG
jgi:putative ABC transport system permease protein